MEIKHIPVRNRYYCIGLKGLLKPVMVEGCGFKGC
jgi:hypothetical protein